MADITFGKHMKGASNLQGYNFQCSTDNFPSHSKTVTELRPILGNEDGSVVLEMQSVKNDDGSSAYAIICSHKTGGNGGGVYTFTESQICSDSSVSPKQLLGLLCESNFLTQSSFMRLSDSSSINPTPIGSMAQVEDDIISKEEYAAGLSSLSPELFAPGGMMREEICRFVSYFWRSCSARSTGVFVSPAVLRVPGVSCLSYSSGGSRISSVPVGVEFFSRFVIPHLPFAVRQNYLSVTFDASRSSISQLEDDSACFVTTQRYPMLVPQLDLVDKKLSMGLGGEADEISQEGIEIGHFLMSPDKKAWPMYFQFQSILGKKNPIMADYDLFELLMAVQKIMNNAPEDVLPSTAARAYRQLMKIQNIYPEIKDTCTLRALLLPLENFVVQVIDAREDCWDDVKTGSGISLLVAWAFSFPEYTSVPGDNIYGEITGKSCASGITRDEEKSLLVRMVSRSPQLSEKITAMIEPEMSCHDMQLFSDVVCTSCRFWGFTEGVLHAADGFLSCCTQQDAAFFRQSISGVITASRAGTANALTQKDIIRIAGRLHLPMAFLRQKLFAIMDPESSDNFQLDALSSIYGTDEELLRCAFEAARDYCANVANEDDAFRDFSFICLTSGSNPQILEKLLPDLLDVFDLLSVDFKGKALVMLGKMVNDKLSSLYLPYSLLVPMISHAKPSERLSLLSELSEGARHSEDSMRLLPLYTAAMDCLGDEEMKDAMVVCWKNTVSGGDDLPKLTQLLPSIGKIEGKSRLPAFLALVSCAFSDGSFPHSIVSAVEMFVDGISAYFPQDSRLDAILGLFAEDFSISDEKLAEKSLKLTEGMDGDGANEAAISIIRKFACTNSRNFTEKLLLSAKNAPVWSRERWKATLECANGALDSEKMQLTALSCIELLPEDESESAALELLDATAPQTVKVVEKLLEIFRTQSGTSRAIAAMCVSPMQSGEMAALLVEAASILPENMQDEIIQKIALCCNEKMSEAFLESLIDEACRQKESQPRKIRNLIDITAKSANMPCFQKVLDASASLSHGTFDTLLRGIEAKAKSQSPLSPEDIARLIDKATASCKDRQTDMENVVVRIAEISMLPSCDIRLRDSLIHACRTLCTSASLQAALHRLFCFVMDGNALGDDVKILLLYEPQSRESAVQLLDDAAAFSKKCDHKIALENVWHHCMECALLQDFDTEIMEKLIDLGCILHRRNMDSLSELLSYFAPAANRNEAAAEALGSRIFPEFDEEIRSRERLPDFPEKVRQSLYEEMLEEQISRAECATDMLDVCASPEIASFIPPSWGQKGSLQLVSVMDSKRLKDAVDSRIHLIIRRCTEMGQITENISQCRSGDSAADPLQHMEFVFHQEAASWLTEKLQLMEKMGIGSKSRMEEISHLTDALKQVVGASKLPDCALRMEKQCSIYDSLTSRSFSDREFFWNLFRNMREMTPMEIMQAKDTVSLFIQSHADIGQEEETGLALFEAVVPSPVGSQPSFDWSKYFSGRLRVTPAELDSIDPYHGASAAVIPLGQVITAFSWLDKCPDDVGGEIGESLRLFLASSMRHFSRKARSKRDFQKEYGIKMDRATMIDAGFPKSFASFMTSFSMK